MASSNIWTLKDMDNTRTNVLCISALHVFLSENTHSFKGSIPDINVKIKQLESEVVEKRNQIIRSPYIFNEAEYKNYEYTLLQTKVVLDFCHQLTLTEDFVQSDKDALIHIALVQMSTKVSELITHITIEPISLSLSI